jgi:hypothetical protein
MIETILEHLGLEPLNAEFAMRTRFSISTSRLHDPGIPVDEQASAPGLGTKTT